MSKEERMVFLHRMRTCNYDHGRYLTMYNIGREEMSNATTEEVPSVTKLHNDETEKVPSLSTSDSNSVRYIKAGPVARVKISFLALVHGVVPSRYVGPEKKWML